MDPPRSPEGSSGRWSACWWSGPVSRGSRSPMRWPTRRWTAWCSRRGAGSVGGCTPWTWAGSPVDLGGSWIHHPDGNPLRRFARQVGIECRPGNPLPSLAAFDCATGLLAVACGHRGEPDRRAGWLHRGARWVAYAAGTGRLGRRGNRGVSWPRPGSRGRPPTSPARTAGSVEADAAGAAEHQSLTWLWTQEEYGGDYFGDLPEGGYASVVRRDGGRARRAPGLAGRTGGADRRRCHGHVGVRGRPRPARTSSSRSRWVCSRATCRPSRHPFRPSEPRSYADSASAATRRLR